MAAAVRRRPAEAFEIHEDGPSTEDTEMNEEGVHQSEAYTEEPGDAEERNENEQQQQPSEPESESDDDEIIDSGVQLDMEKLQHTFPGFRHMYRLIKRIGEGTFSTVYKAEDLQYEMYRNDWDLDKENDKWTPPPLKRHVDRLDSSADHSQTRRRRPKFVAIKKIYVTSSPQRIINELELLHDLRNAASVCPLITAFRHADQVIAILPYFRHHDFRQYFRQMTTGDMAIYLRSLFTALAAVHAAGILHRDIKPTNFLYDPESQRGVLVDFGLAEREGSESKPCLCHDEPAVRKGKLRAAYVPSAPHNGYPKNDTRPSRRANRAGTRGFRAPEVLFKCTEQTAKIDVWSAGVILLTILSRRFPFFNSADDVEAMIEIATLFGSRQMRQAGQLHGCMFETTIPTIGSQGYGLDRIVLWSTCRIDNGKPLNDEERSAVDFLTACLELDPSRRISSADALKHPFLKEQDVDEEDEDIDILLV